MIAVSVSLAAAPALAQEPPAPPSVKAPPAGRAEEPLAGAPPGEAVAPQGSDRSSHEAMSDLYKLFQRVKPTPPPPAK